MRGNQSPRPPNYYQNMSKIQDKSWNLPQEISFSYLRIWKSENDRKWWKVHPPFDHKINPGMFFWKILFIFKFQVSIFEICLWRWGPQMTTSPLTPNLVIKPPRVINYVGPFCAQLFNRKLVLWRASRQSGERSHPRLPEVSWQYTKATVHASPDNNSMWSSGDIDLEPSAAIWRYLGHLG